MANSCNGCGQCCKLFLINLSQKEYQSGRYQTMFKEQGIIKNFKQAQACGANLLEQKQDRSCIYLVNDQCLIHAARPRACRDFFCTSKAKKFREMVKIIKNKDKQKIASVDSR